MTSRKNTKNTNRLIIKFSLLIIGLFLLIPGAVLANENTGIAALPIDNFGKVSNVLWRGGVPSDSALEQLAECGVKTVIDLRSNWEGCKHEQNTVTKLGLHYIHLPMGFKKPDYADITDFLKVMSNPINFPVYIHCHQGADRTGVLVGIYRILTQNWTYDQSYHEMRSHHFKPWLVSMKKTVAVVAEDNSTREVLEAALHNADTLETQAPLVTASDNHI